MADDTSTDRLPIIIPNLDLIKRIGKGSYGEVWLAKSTIDTFCAVKIVFRANFDDDRPYHREFSAIKKFEPISRSHPSQVDILHVGRNTDQDYFYYVMELADDASPTGAILDPRAYTPKTLKSEFRSRGPLPAAECVRIGLALAKALEHLHENGLIHRDVKPSNIIIVNGVAKLADIGLVTHIDATKSLVGTEAYLPQENIGTPQADVFALGKVLYEMSTGNLPSDFPELPETWRGRADQTELLELNESIVKACAVDPKDRYASASELASELTLLEGGKSLKRAHRKQRFWATSRRTALLAAVLAVLAVGLREFRPWERSGSPEFSVTEEYIRTDPFEEPIGAPGTDYRDRGALAHFERTDTGKLRIAVDRGNGTGYVRVKDGVKETLPFNEGATLEVGVDLLEQEPASILFSPWVGVYMFGKSESLILRTKKHLDGSFVPLMWEKTSVKADNLRFVMQLTPSAGSVSIRVQVIDLKPPHQILFDQSVVDTPGQDVVQPYVDQRFMSRVEKIPAPQIGTPVDYGIGFFNPHPDDPARVVVDNFEAKLFSFGPRQPQPPSTAQPSLK